MRPRGTSLTDTMLRAGIIQEVLRDPELTVGIFSHIRPKAKDFLRQIKTEFEGGQQVWRKWAVENSGLCMLLTWTIEILKQRIRHAQKGIFEPGDF